MRRFRKQKAKFFCESCGAEVASNAKVCTNCGKFFSSVRCPNCGKIGRTEDFISGCPDCGYANIPGVGPAYKKQSKNKNKSYGNIFYDIFKTKKTNSAAYESGLPLWVYIVSISVLVLIIIGLYSCLNME